jgi:hypothetical protein
MRKSLCGFALSAALAVAGSAAFAQSDTLRSNRLLRQRMHNQCRAIMAWIQTSN